MIDETIFHNRMPPTIQDVKIYFSQKGMPTPEAEAFFLFQEKRQWSNRRGKSFVEWKGAARRWIASVIYNCPSLFERSNHYTKSY